MLKRKWSRFGLLVLVGLTAVGAIAFALNRAPQVPAVSQEDGASKGRPLVVKVHAQWCPVCLMGKSTWSRLQATYANRVNMVVFDVTNKGSAAVSEVEASRLGLGEFFQEHGREVGSVYVLDGGSKQVRAVVPGLSDLSVYVDAVEEALNSVIVPSSATRSTRL